MANKLISKRLLEDYKMKQCERFSGEGRMTQYFKCQHYGHVAKSCRNETTCSHCAENHHNENCTHKTMLSCQKCAVCLCSGHEAWSPNYESRKEQKVKAKKAYEKRPAIYKVMEIVIRKTAPSINKLAVVQTSQPVDTNMTSKPTGAPYKVVTNKKRPREVWSNSLKASNEETRGCQQEDSFVKIIQLAHNTDTL